MSSPRLRRRLPRSDLRVGLQFPSYACCSRPASSLSIESIASITRFALAGSPPPPSKLPSCFGMICHDNPNLSLSHPHRLGDPPSAVSLSHRASISCWVSHPTKNETASLNLSCAPPLSPMNFWPSSSYSTDITLPCARCTDRAFARGKMD